MFPTLKRLPQEVVELARGKRITNPSAYLSPSNVLQMLNAGSLIENTRAFYEEEGMEVPDFDKLTKIEKMEALAEYRTMLQQKRAEMQEHAKKAVEKEQLKQQKANAKANAGSAEPPTPTTGGTGKT